MEGATLAHAVAGGGSKEENGTCCDDGAGGGRDRKCARRCRNTRLIAMDAPAFGRGGHDRHHAGATANADAMGTGGSGGCDGLGGFVIEIASFFGTRDFFPFSSPLPLGLPHHANRQKSKNEHMMCWD